MYAVELLALAAVAVPVLVKQWLALRGGGADGYVTHPSILGYAVVYLAVMTVLWVSALPDYFGATNGLTAMGDPVGSLWYGVICLGIAAASTIAAWTVTESGRRGGTGQRERIIASRAAES
ncbi:Uncharacterised protein [Mycobacteroides abscessus]|nr:Uncharacterised protein [Mycobacteroides abscessus]